MGQGAGWGGGGGTYLLEQECLLGSILYIINTNVDLTDTSC